MLKLLAEYRKSKKKQLTLRDIGLDSDKNIYLNESLTYAARSLLHKAVQMKRHKQIFSVFTRHGDVIVKCSSNDRGIKIVDEITLFSIAERTEADFRQSQHSFRANVSIN